MLSFTLDDSRLRALLGRLESHLDAGFPRAMKRADQIMARSTALTFRSRGRPAWLPLSPFTLRQTMGRRVAGDAPLRLTDTLRRAVVSPAGAGSVGQVSRVSAFEAIRGTDLLYAGTQQFGRKRIPARPFLMLQSQDVIEIADVTAAELAQQVRSAVEG